MISGIVLIFAVPMIIAALLISPTAFHNLIHGLPLYAVLGVIVPIAGWRTFLIEFAVPRAADTRLAAVYQAVGGRDRDGRRRLQPLNGRTGLFSSETRTQSHRGLPARWICPLYVHLVRRLGRFRSDLAAEGCGWWSVDDWSFAFSRRRDARVSGLSVGVRFRRSTRELDVGGSGSASIRWFHPHHRTRRYPVRPTTESGRRHP